MTLEPKVAREEKADPGVEDTRINALYSKIGAARKSLEESDRAYLRLTREIHSQIDQIERDLGTLVDSTRGNVQMFAPLERDDLYGAIMSFDERAVIYLRKEVLGLTQREFAEKLGTNQVTINRWENSDNGLKLQEKSAQRFISNCGDEIMANVYFRQYKVREDGN
jgi:DNA-binding transcriptional regulator YiaG